MITRAIGWQTTLTDLALILFLVSAAGLHAQQQEQAPEPPPAIPAEVLPASAEPLAVYRARGDAPPLAEWLAEQAPDRRQHLTIVARYRAGDAAAAAGRAVALAEQAGAAGVSARIVLEPGARADLLATLAYDRPDAVLARPLQHASQD